MNPIDLLKQGIIASYPNIWKKTLHLKRNEYLKVKGSRDTNIYYVEVGTLRAFIEDEYEEHTIRFGYPGSIITALDSFITQQPSPFYLQAIKKCALKVIPRAIFMDFVAVSPKNASLWRQILEQLTYQQLEREIDLLTHSPAKRYERVLARSPRLFQEIPSKYIASYLRMTPETLSRIKKL